MPDRHRRGGRAGGRTRVKLLGNFGSPHELCAHWDRMSQGALRWNDIEVTPEDRDVDFYALINHPRPGDHFVPERTIVFPMEPWCAEPWQTWGVKTWGEWASPDPARFLQVRGHRTHLNNAFWQLRSTYHDLKTQPIAKSRCLASICSPKYFDPGHVKRVDFLRFLERKNDDVVRVDLYAHDNPLGFRSWVGPHPAERKDAALLPYRYFFAAENNRERNFITEKLWEPLLTETLCFYWGCPNAGDWIDPRAFIPVDLDDFEGAFRTMKDAILADEWERRIDVIRHEKRKALEHYQFFPTLERVLRHELRLPPHPTDAEVLHHKHFADALGETIGTACFIHSYTRGRDTTILAELLARVEASGLLERLDRLYVVNVGAEAALPPGLARHAHRVRLIHYSPDASRGEAPTLNLVRSFAAVHPAARILYLHTKGASRGAADANVADWRRMLLHFLVDRHAVALAALADYDVVGCNLLAQPQRHFSGNFWWANAGHLMSLDNVPGDDRHAAEWWVLGRAGVRACGLHDSGIDHYRQPYPPSRYEPAADAGPAQLASGPGPEAAEAPEAAEVPEVAQEVSPSATDPRALPPADAVGAKAPSICLVMIVKDEAHVVAEALASVAPYIADFVVVDTGSTDGTQQTIRAHFAAQGIPGQVFDRPWRDFGANRSDALELAREHSASDYLWMLDADDVVSGQPELGSLDADGYELRFGEGVEYWRPQIFRRELPWRYVGVLHEYATCDIASARVDRIGGDYRVLSRRLGSRNRDPRKYERDAAILEQALAADPGNARYAFYLAQSWYDAGRFDVALAAYERRATMNGWSEEVFYSRYRAAQCLERLGRPLPDVLAAYEACFRQHPHRAEPLVRAAALALADGRNAQAYVLAKLAARVPRPAPGALFVETADYDFRAPEEYAVAALRCGFPDETHALCSQLLGSGRLTDDQRARVETTRDLAVPYAKDAFLRYDKALVNRLSLRIPSPEPRVTLTMTSCRRLDLFVGTVNSFLNSCADIDLVDRFLCIDDNSSAADRAEMRRLFPFFEFVWKGPEDRGHARSLNLIRDAVRTPWLVHLEDDWHFFVRRAYIGPAIEILEEDATLGQVLFNRNYAEVLEDRGFAGGFRRRTARHGHGYVAHEHYPADSEAYARFQKSHGRRSNAWWPHYSLRPAVVRASVFAQVGPFDEGPGHFELDYAQRYVRAGFASCFLDGVHALHTGRLTTERGDAARLNAYALNGQAQFGETRHAPAPGGAAPALAARMAVRVINLDRRPDRLASFQHRLAATTGPDFAARVRRFPAIDGRTLTLTPELRDLFRGNDFGYRRSFVGCALSHMMVWEELVDSDVPACLVLEDDAVLCTGFESRLVALCGELEARHPAFDLLLLGYTDWQPRPEDDGEANPGAASLRPFDGSRYLGGSYAYVISRDGARRLLEIVERDGIQYGIDRFIHRKEAELRLLVATPHIARSQLVPPGSGLDSDIQNDFAALPEPSASD